MRIMQGDSYSIPVLIKSANGIALDNTSIESVEITVGFIRKTFPGEITFSGGKWLFPLSQEETIKLRKGSHDVQVRVKMSNGDVVGVKQRSLITVENSESKVII